MYDTAAREMIEGFWSPGGSPKFVGVRRVIGSGDVWLSESEMDYPTGERWIGVSLFEFEWKSDARDRLVRTAVPRP